MVAQGLIVGIKALAYFHYSANPHVAGFLFGAFGVGALLGAIVAQQLAQKVDLLKLAAFAIALMPLPLLLLAIAMPWAAAMVVVGGVRVLHAARQRADHRRAHRAHAAGAAAEGDDRSDDRRDPRRPARLHRGRVRAPARLDLHACSS